MSLHDLAQQLATARQQRSQIAGTLLDNLQSDDEAYQLQALAIERYPSPQAGYKVGATNETSQQMLGCSGPFFGPIFEADSLESGTSFELDDSLLGGEAEFAFLIDRDIPTNSALTQSQIAEYIAATHIAVELIGRRTAGQGLPKSQPIIADFGGNTAFIRGPAVDNWQSMDLSEVKVVAKTDGEETNSGTGAAVLGNPLNSLLWLHETLRSRGEQLKGGQWVSTGTCLGVIQPKAGSTVDIHFEGCGNVSYELR